MSNNNHKIINNTFKFITLNLFQKSFHLKLFYLLFTDTPADLKIQKKLYF